MARLVRRRLIFAAAMTLAMFSSPDVGVRAQDAGVVTAANPEVTATALVTDSPAPTAPVATIATPEATEATTIPPAPEATEAATTPVATEPATKITPVSTPVATEAASAMPTTAAPASTTAQTTLPPTAAPSTSQVASESSATMLQEATSPQSSMRSSEAGSSLRGSDAENSASASSSSSSSKSASEATTGTLNGSSSTKTAVLCMLGGVGLTIIMSLLFVVWRSRRREDQNLGTPTPPDTATITFPAISMPIVAPTGQDLSSWKASESSFTSRDLPLTASTRAKLNATTRSSTEFDLANRHSQIASLPTRGTLTQAPQANRETNTSSEQSFSIRGYSEFSVHHSGDSEPPATTNERDSTNDGYSTSDRYSTNGRYSTSSRLSSEPGRSNSGWFQRQMPKNLDMHRFSSTSSTASSFVARKHNPASFINHDLTQTPCTDAPVTTDSTTSRTDVPDWYSVIESPSDNDRYTTSSLDSGKISSERESFEL